MLIAKREDGTVVSKGDIVTDFRGDEWTFCYPTRSREEGKSGKLVAERDSHQREFYDNVFKITVTN